MTTNKLTTEQFINKAREVHDDFYDYSKAEYTRSRTKVIITCPEHGDFEQTPFNHLKGSGCLKCNKNYKLTKEEFIEKSKQVHGDKYSYDKVEYKGVDAKVTITCPEHGDFEQISYNHMKGNGCVRCANTCKNKSNTEEFIKKARDVHGDKYSYDKVEYTGNKEKVTITCPEHGDFEQIPDSHLRGNACPDCYLDITRSNTEQFIQKAKEIHGDFYDYGKVEYKSVDAKVTITCPTHGDFIQVPNAHLSGSGCSKCKADSISELFSSNDKELIQKARQVHGDKYSYDKVEYNGVNVNVIITCLTHGDFEQMPSIHLRGSGCPKCSNTGPSNMENELFAFVQSIVDDEVIQSDRSIISPYELDIVIPSKKVAIEFNGLYWHSEKFIQKNYHLDKTNKTKEQGYQLIHIFEDEWIDKKTLVKEKLSHLLGGNEISLYARNCYIGQPSKKEKTAFYNTNHIQGAVGTGIDIGLYYGFDLVACLSFVDKGEGVYDLIRFASAIHVVGGFSKLLKYFKKNYEWSMIYTFADKRYSTGNLYLTNGFEWLYDTKPNYWYVNNGRREIRIKYQKHKLKNLLESFDPELTEVENCNNHGLYRIFDCGHMKFEMRNE